MSRVTKIYGPPGTGKTTTLLGLVSEDTTPLDRVLMTTFRRTAAEELVERLDVTKEVMPWACTIHAAAYRLVAANGQRPKPAMDNDRRAFSKALGESLEDGSRLAELFRIHDFAPNTMTDPEQYWRRPTTQPGQMSDRERHALWQKWTHWKLTHGLLDWSEIFHEAMACPALPVDVAYIDEAQDCTPLMWAFLRAKLSPTARIYLIGDDDQSINGWAGADGRLFVAFHGIEQVLHQSYRVPRCLKQVAEGVIRRVSHRAEKPYQARDAEGLLRRVGRPADLGLAEGQWLLLARTKFELRQWVDVLIEQGLNFRHLDAENEDLFPRKELRLASIYEHLRRGYAVPRESAFAMLRGLAPYCPRVGRVTGGDLLTWPDVFPHPREQAAAWDHETVFPFSRPVIVRLRSLHRHHELAGDPNRIRVGTIHAAKGLQADHVALLGHQTPRIQQSILCLPNAADEEHRVWYVAVTRARESLSLLTDPTWPYKLM